MNFIIDLPLSKEAYCLYNFILKVLDYYIKVIRYLLLLNTIDIMKLTNIIYIRVFLRYR